MYRKNCVTVCNALAYKRDSLKALVSLYTGQLISMPNGTKETKRFDDKQKELDKNNIRKAVKQKMRKNKKEQ